MGHLPPTRRNTINLGPDAPRFARVGVFSLVGMVCEVWRWTPVFAKLGQHGRYNSEMAPNARPWYRWHWLTWVVGLIVLAGLVARQIEKCNTFGITNLGVLTEWSDFGWPFTGANLVECYWNGPVPTAEMKWNGFGVLFNVIFCVVSLAAVVFLSERWLRAPRRLQFGLREVLPATTTAAALSAATISEWRFAYLDFDRDSLVLVWTLIDTQDLLPIHWPSLFALACLFYSASLLIIWLLERAWRFRQVRQQQPVPPSAL